MAKPQEDLQKAHKRRKQRESLLETLESIVVAFVLAFIFRAFIVEAFVIPTGSMAPTLYGAHAEFHCQYCGTDFAVGADGPLAHEPICPNCYLTQQVSERTRIYSGDRILVLKYLYDFLPPRRWDVIVFHNPNDPTQNYIKRLVGLPGETLELIDGNVTIDGRIAHKTDKAQSALWMPVHDTRRRPYGRDWDPRWVPDKEWRIQDAGFVLDKAPEKDRLAWLAYRHIGPNGRPGNILDYYAYNSGNGHRPLGSAAVTDLGLRTEVTAGQPTSVVVVDLRAYKDRFRFELTAAGSDQPTRILFNDKVAARAAGGVLPVGRSAEVQVANVDHKLVLLVDGRRVAGQGAAETTPEGDVVYEPRRVSDEDREKYDNPVGDDPHSMAAEVRVGARGGPVSVAYLRLDRDVYYLNDNANVAPGKTQRPGNGVEGHPFVLGQGEYFVCGDNSPKSFDSRMWDLSRPVVPQENLVGKAFFIYWPSAGWRWGIPVAPDLTGFRLVH
jgi:signal peptidase I